MNIYFNKMHALGNDFVVFETITQSVLITPSLIKKMSDRHFGIGCDQVLVLGKSQHPKADFDYTIYNADGSSAKQCGNGARCIALFAQLKNLTAKKQITFATFDHLTTVDITHPTQISVAIGIPNFDPATMPMQLPQAPRYTLTLAHQSLSFGALSIGNPHVIIEVPDVNSAQVDTIGAAFNHHPLFPEGVNVSFCQILSDEKIKLRVFERGAGETLACGSAACATMAYLRQQGLIKDQIIIQLPGGNLTVSWKNNTSPVILTGDAINVFEGIYHS
jgi:diaminopimelate epimerase